jgi:hypothetical protein
MAPVRLGDPDMSLLLHHQKDVRLSPNGQARKENAVGML